MKALISLVLICGLNGRAKPFFEWQTLKMDIVTDSIVWRVTKIDSLNLGNENHKHDWIYSTISYDYLDRGCLVMHHGFHCDWDDGRKERICSICHRHEYMREFWYQHRYISPKTDYDKLKDKLKKGNK